MTVFGLIRDIRFSWNRYMKEVKNGITRRMVFYLGPFVGTIFYDRRL